MLSTTPNGDEHFGTFLRENALRYLRRSILDPAELLAFRPWLFRLTDLFNLCAVAAMLLFAWGKVLIVPLPAALLFTAFHTLLHGWMRLRAATEQTVRREFLQTMLSCTLAVVGYTAIVAEPIGTVVAFCSLTFVTFTIIGIAPWGGMLMLAVLLISLYAVRIIQVALGLPVNLAPYPVNIVSAGGFGWIALVLFTTTSFITDMVWRQKVRNRLAQRELEDANARLRAAERARTEFLAAVTHELRTPLVAIHGYTDLLLMRHHEEDASLLIIKRSATRLQRLIDELIDTAAPLNLASRMQFVQVGLHDIVQEEIAAVANRAIDAGVKLEICSLAHCVVKADRLRIGQVIGNLLDNALKHSRSGGRVHVSLQAENGQALFEVADDGPGIPADQLAHIFEPFYTQAKNQSVPSMGLGLAICNQIVAALGGAITVESEPGKGSRFCVRVPLDDRLPRREMEPQKIYSALVLDDEADVLSLMCEVLGTFGFHVETVRNGSLALEKGLKNSYDLILLDINVPGLTGIEVARRLKASGQTAKVLLFSALIRQDADTIIAEAQADGFFPKPFSLEILQKYMAELGYCTR